MSDSNGYEVGRRLRWLVGDLSHLYLVLRGKGISADTPGKLRTLYDVLFTGGARTNVGDWRYGDFGPARHRLAAELTR